MTGFYTYPEPTPEGLEGLTKRRNELNQASPLFANRDFKKAKKGVDEGQATHAVDKVVR
ncbi:hypothetical protein [Brucella sp. LJL56]